MSPKLLGVLLAASAAFAIVASVDSCNNRKIARQAEKKLDESDSILAKQKRDIKAALEFSAQIDSANDTLFQQKQKLQDSLGQAQDSVDVLVWKRFKDRKLLVQAKTSMDSITALSIDVINLEDIIEQKDKSIRTLRATEAKSLAIINNLTVDRDGLRNNAKKNLANAERLDSLNKGLRKDLAKLQREPLVDFDIGLGLAAMPDLSKPLDFNKWKVGPAVTGTVSLHP